MRKAFTLMELIVALGIMAVVLAFAGVIFRVSIDSQRLALANAEIMQKLRVITEQLDADFRGLRRDAEIFVVWGAQRKIGYSGSQPNGSLAFERFDRIMFFTSGDFQTYGVNPDRSNIARVCYTLARGPSVNAAEPNWAQMQLPRKRILARTQHVLVPPVNLADQLDTRNFTTEQWLEWNSERETDKISLEGWKRMPLADKANVLSVIGDVTVETESGPLSTTEKAARGVLIDRAKPASIHAVFCEGVGQFMIQGWNDAQQRWIPEVNPNEDDSLSDSDFLLTSDGTDLDPENDPGVWYPRGGFKMGGVDYTDPLDEEHFSAIPGLGRALKFTFTLYDSRNLIPDGRTFTHIVYLDP
jgi:prepilin-type N-terminal cleavage/methylation domain-containing protein